MPSIIVILRMVFALVISIFLIAPSNAQTLKTVKDRGHLICATTQPMYGFAQQNSNGLWSGFDIDFCRAISAAIFGDPDKVEFRPYDGDARFAPLQMGKVDIFVRNAPWTISHDNNYQVRYVATSFFDGQAFLVKQKVEAVSAHELNDVNICLISNYDEQYNLGNFFFNNQADYEEILYEDYQDLELAYSGGLCDVIFAPASKLYSIVRNLKEPNKHQILPERISKEPLGPVVRANDDEWFNIIRWVLFALLNSEELGVTSLSVASMSDVKNPAIRRLLGLELDFGAPLGLEKDWAQIMIAKVGNYREIYEKSFGPQTGASLPRGVNALWTNGGLLFAPPIR